MHAFKDKVARMFSDPLKSAASYAFGESQEKVNSSPGGKYFPSILSYINPASNADEHKAATHSQRNGPDELVAVRWKSFEWQDKHFSCGGSSPELENKKSTGQGNEDDHSSGRSSCNSEVFEDAPDPPPSKSMSNLTEDSSFITPELYEFFESSLPNIVKDCQWVLLYSTLKHGISLRTLIHKSSQLSGPSLLIVGDTQGAVFGGLLECPLQPTAKRKYQGTNQSFVFTNIYGEPHLFRPTGLNRYFYLCLNDLLALGGGRNFALCLDEDLLTGTSGPCETFGNSCLARKPEFSLKNVELWGFAHASQYITRQRGFSMERVPSY